MKSYHKLFLILIVVLLAIRIFWTVFGTFDLVPDEAYYWDWSRHPDWSYYSKGPMVAYLIYLSTHLGGNYAFWVRFPSIVLSTITIWLIYNFSLSLFHSKRISFYTAFVFSCIPLFFIGSMLMTIDCPLFFFWTLAVYSLYKAIFLEQRGYWWLASISLGLGLMTKFVMIFWVVSILLFLITSRNYRKHLYTPYPYICIVLGLIFLIPQIYWNYKNQWAMFIHFLHKGGVGEGLTLHPLYFFRYLGSQAGVINPLFFFGVVYAMYESVRRGFKKCDEKFRFLASFFIPVFAFYTLLSFHNKIGTNWLVVGYLTPIIAGISLWDEFKQKIIKPNQIRNLKILSRLSFGVSLLVIMIVLFSEIFYFLPIEFSPRLDITNRAKGWRTVGNEINRQLKEMKSENKVFILSNKYQFCAEIAFYTPEHPNTYCYYSTPFQNQYYFWNDFEQLKGYDCLYFGRYRKKVFRAFDSFEELPSIQIFRRGRLIRTYRLFRCYNFNGF